MRAATLITSRVRAFLAIAALLIVLALIQLCRFGVFAVTPTDGPLGANRHQMERDQIVPRASEPATILVIGTSLSAYGAWLEDVEAQLSACRDGDVTIDIVAKPGAASDWGIGALEETLASRGDEIDVVIIEFATNDAAWHRGVPLAKSKSYHRRMIAAAGKRPVYLAIMNPSFGSKGWVRPGLDAYNRTYLALGAETPAKPIDTRPGWATLTRNGWRTAIPDGLHPTQSAMEQVAANAFVDHLSPLLCAE